MTKKISISLFLLLSGCLYPVEVKLPEVTVEPVAATVAVDNQYVSAFDNVSKEDCVKLYKFFKGISLYVQNSSGEVYVREIFGQEDSLLNKVQKDYGYDKQKYPSLTLAVNQYLTEGGYKDPDRQIKDYRNDLVNRFDTLAEAAKLAYEAKHE